MANDYTTNPTFAGRIDAGAADYPQGKAQDITVPSDGTGTPWIAVLLNDWFGFSQAALKRAGITPSGTPDTADVSQILQSVLQLGTYVNVKAFGAVGDGIVDDTIAVQDAINSVSPLGGAVAFPGGNYSVNKINVPSNITLVGVGGELTLRDAQNTALIECPVGTSRVIIANLKLNGNSANNITTPVDIGVVTILSSGASPSTDIFIDNCEIADGFQNNVAIHDQAERIKITDSFINGTDTLYGILTAVVGATVAGVVIESCSFAGTGSTCIATEGVTSSIRVANCFFDSAGQTPVSYHISLESAGGTDITITNCTGQNSPNRGILVGGDRVAVSNNVIKEYGLIGIHLLTDNAAVIAQDATISNNVCDGAVGSTKGIEADTAPGVAITGNTVRNGTQDGIRVANSLAAGQADGFTIAGNTIIGFANQGIQIAASVAIADGTISSNTCDGENLGTNGIQITENASDINISGNRCFGWTTGIDEVAGSGNNLYGVNHLRGNTTAISAIDATSDAFGNKVA